MKRVQEEIASVSPGNTVADVAVQRGSDSSSNNTTDGLSHDA